MYKRMLVPLDGSELAEVVFGYARELAGRLDLAIILLHVCRPREHDLLPMHRAYIEHAADILRHQSVEVQQKTRSKPGVKAVQARGEVVEGYPAEEILIYADKNNIDLILLASHGHSGVRRWALGGVADKVLRASKVPIWLARAAIPEAIVHDKWPQRTMLVPLDGSQHAESVLPHVEALAKQRGAELVDVVLLRVCEPPINFLSYSSALCMPLDWDVEKETLLAKRECEQYLDGVQKHLSDVGLRVRSEVLLGKPIDEIIAYTSRNPFNLVVLATHGRSGITRWSYGQVAVQVLQRSTSPVFLVRPQKNQDLGGAQDSVTCSSIQNSG